MLANRCPGRFDRADPRVGSSLAEQVQRCLGLSDRDIISEVAPPTLRSSVIRFFDDTFAVAVTRRTDRDRHAIMFRDRSERRGEFASRWITDRGHPIETPPTRQATKFAGHLVERIDHMRLVLRFT